MLDPSRMLLWQNYGNFCGFFNNGQGGGPIDDLDEACAEHDDCLATWNRIFRNPCLLYTCNPPLCKAAWRALLGGGCDKNWPGPLLVVQRNECKSFTTKIIAACAAVAPSHAYTPLVPIIG